ncbi:MAG: hypothetical protein ACLQDY_08865 [Streptosporangiaceae bacterium]
MTCQIDQFGAPRVITTKGLLAAPNGGNARAVDVRGRIADRVRLAGSYSAGSPATRVIRGFRFLAGRAGAVLEVSSFP